jgi:hypothetical protein
LSSAQALQRDGDFERGTQQTRQGRVSLGNHCYHIISSTIERKKSFSDFNAARAASQTFAASAQTENAELIA